MYSEKFYDAVNAINANDALKALFVSTSQASRVYNVISTNIKNLNTFYTYYDDVTNHPDLDNHQKIPCCKKLRIYDTSKPEERVRGDLLQKFSAVFPNSSAFPRVMFISLLLLNSEYNIHEGSEYLYNILPENLLSEYDRYLGDFLKETVNSIKNPIMGIFALKSDENALFTYIDLYNNEHADFDTTVANVERDFACVAKRISNCQRSTFPVEAVIFSMYTMFAQRKYIGLTYQEIADALVEAYSDKVAAIGKANINAGSIFTAKDSDVDKIREFLAVLNPAEQAEIIKCLGGNTVTAANAGVSTKKSKEKAPRAPRKPNKTYLNRGGKDVYRTCKSRKGQAEFRKALIDKDGEGCAIPGCRICGDEHVIASHIVAWTEAGELEKTDPNNGLVLCPNHDHLFDGHLISFDQNGKIIISKKLSAVDCDAFGINQNIKLDFSPERELYMRRHRKALK